MVKIVLKSYAKVNLFLEVIGKRNDGYHNIRTIYQTLDLADDIILEKIKRGIVVKCENIDIPFNIVYKAASKILSYSNIKGGVKITITKRIPLAAGLGGGSSNAAVTLKGINTLFNLGLSFEELFNIAKECGSDVPFFLKGGTALGEGRGEILTYLPSIRGLYFILVKNSEKISTKIVYENLKIKLTKRNIFGNKIREFLSLKEIKGGDVAKILHNDLESVGIKLFPNILNIKRKLREEGVLGSLMSGSGPTVFGLVGERKRVYQIYNRIKNFYRWVCVSKSIIPE
jgi:4-diphosphocytidyl-2-C-methyl-D-erythritol kinase